MIIDTASPGRCEGVSAFARYREAPSSAYGDVYGRGNPWVEWLREHHPSVLTMAIGKFRGLATPREAK